MLNLELVTAVFFVQGYKGRQILNVYICRILCQNLFAFLIISGLFVIVCACFGRFVCFVIGRIIKVNEIIGSSAFESGQQRCCSQTGCVYANYGRFIITVGINIRQARSGLPSWGMGCLM